MKKNRVSLAEMDDLNNNTQAFKLTKHCRNRVTLKYFAKVCALFNRLFSKTVFNTQCEKYYLYVYGMHSKLIGSENFKFSGNIFDFTSSKCVWYIPRYILLRNTVLRSNLRTKLSSLFATKLGSLFGIYSIKTELMKLVNI